MSSNSIVYTSEPLLTRQSIRQGIFNAVKLKTNYNLLIENGNNNKTGGVFTDSIWLKTNYNNTNNKQYVVGKLLHDIENNNDYIKGNQFNSVMELDEKIDINISDEMKNILGVNNQTELNKIPILDTKHIFMKMVHDDAEKYNMYLKMINDKYNITDDIDGNINKQKLLLAGYDVVIDNNNTYISTLYSVSDSVETKLTYAINNDKFTITNKTDDTIYYPYTLVVKTLATNRYAYNSDNNGIYIEKIDNIALNPNYKIYCDFQQYDNYTFSTYTINE